MKSPLDAAIEQINGMGYNLDLYQYGQVSGYWVAWVKPCVGWSVTGVSLEEAVLNLLDKLKTVKELG